MNKTFKIIAVSCAVVLCIVLVILLFPKKVSEPELSGEMSGELLEKRIEYALQEQEGGRLDKSKTVQIEQSDALRQTQVSIDNQDVNISYLFDGSQVRCVIEGVKKENADKVIMSVLSSFTGKYDDEELKQFLTDDTAFPYTECSYKYVDWLSEEDDLRIAALTASCIDVKSSRKIGTAQGYNVTLEKRVRSYEKGDELDFCFTAIK